jgi:hypothetical protein
VLVYGASFLLLVLFAYFIYNFLFVNYKVSITNTGNILLSTAIKADDLKNAKRDITKIPDTNARLPTITEGGEFTVSFWIYISSYNTINLGKRKHIFEIYGDNFSTLLVALGARTPTLLVRLHTAQELDATGKQWGLTDCSGIVRPGLGLDDCSGVKLGYQELTDKNLMNAMRDNTLTRNQINDFFKANIVVDENNLIDSTSTCDYKTLEISKWNNVCLVMNSKTLEIYLNGKLVKSCVYHSYFRVDNTGLKVSYLQQQAGFDGYLSRIQLFNNVLNPDEIYKNYLQGPDGNSVTSDPLSFIKYIFT